MKTKFSVYDPSVQQALEQQKSQYVVPRAPWQETAPQPVPEPAPQPAQSWGVTQPPPPEMALTSTDGASTYMAPRVDPMAFAGDMPVLNELDVTPAPVQARIPPPDMAPQSAPPASSPDNPDDWRLPDDGTRVNKLGLVTRSIVGGKPSANQSKARMDAAFNGMGDAIEQRQQTAEELGQARAETGRSTADLLQASTVDDAMAQEQLAKAQDDHIAATNKVQQEQRELTSFISNYEPKDRRSTAKKVMGALAVGLSAWQDQNNLVAGLMQGMNVQTNNAARVQSMINTSIDRDIDLQRQMLDNKRTALAAKNSELGQMRERYGDSVEALKFARAMKIDQYQKELQAIVARGGAQEAVLTAKDAIGQLDLQKQQLFYEGNRERYQQELRARQGMSMAQRLTLEGKALDNAKKRQELEGNGSQVFIGKDVQITNPEAYRAWVNSKPNAAEQEKLRAGVQGYAQLRSALGNLKALKEKYGSEGRILPSEAGALMDQERERVIAALNMMKDGSVMQEGEYKRAMEQVPGSGDFAFTALPKLDAIEASVRGQANSKLEQIGAAVVTPADLTRPLSR